jgi:hypothetical protein
MAIFYPRKQTVIILLVCIVVVGATAYYTSSGSSSNASTEQNTLAVNAKVPTNEAAVSQIDTSGLSDWKEQFVDTSNTSKTANSATPKQKLSNTDSFARDFFSRYVELKQANLLNNTDIVNQTAADLVTAHVKSDPLKVYTKSDLHIVPATPASLNNFSIRVGQIMESYKVSKNEATILQEYLATNDPMSLKGIAPIVATYKRMISSFLATPTPDSETSDALDLINSFSAFEYAAENMVASDADSVNGLSGVSIHSQGAQAMITALTNIHDSLRSQGITFNFRQEVLNTLLL